MPLEPAKKERSLIRHAPAVGQARIILLLPTHLLYYRGTYTQFGFL